jgi:hypothetical protein
MSSIMFNGSISPNMSSIMFNGFIKYWNGVECV